MKVELKCKICDKVIQGCFTCRDNNLSWKNVACCIEHFQEYMLQVEQARKQEK